MPQEMIERREVVVGRLKQLQIECATILSLIDDQALVKQLKTEKLFTPQHLQEKYEVSQDSIDALYKFASFSSSVAIIQQQPSTFTISVHSAPTKTKTSVHCGANLQQKFLCRTGRLHWKT
jgi:hypothetical protein